MTTFWMLPEGGALVPPLFLAQTTPVKTTHDDSLIFVLFIIFTVILASMLFGIYMDIQILRRRLGGYEARMSAVYDALHALEMSARYDNALQQSTNAGPPPKSNRKARRENIVAAMEVPKKPSMVLQRKSRENLVSDTDVTDTDGDRIFE